MADRSDATVIHVAPRRAAPEPRPLRPRNHADANKQLSDTPYLVYCLMQACKLFVKLVEARWPEAS